MPERIRKKIEDYLREELLAICSLTEAGLAAIAFSEDASSVVFCSQSNWEEDLRVSVEALDREQASALPLDQLGLPGKRGGERVYQNQIRILEPYEKTAELLCFVDPGVATFDWSRVENQIEHLRHLFSLRELESFFRRKVVLLDQVVEHLPTPLIVADANRRIQKINPAFVDLFGYKPEEVIGQTTELLYEASGKYDELGEQRFNASAVPDKTPYRIRYRRKSGDLFESETIGTSILDESGTFVSNLALINDLTASNQQLRNLRLKDSVIDSASEAILCVDRNGIISFSNHSAASLIGLSQSELLDTPFYELDVEMDQADWQNTFENLQKDGACKYESTYLKRNLLGSEKPFIGATKLRILDLDDATLASVMIEDITESTKLRDSLIKNRTVTDQFSQAVLWINESGYVTYANKAACEIIGLTEFKPAEFHVGDVDQNLRGNLWTTKWQHLKRTRSVSQQTIKLETKGVVRWMAVFDQFFGFDEDNFVVREFRNVTSEIENQLELRRTKAALEHAVNPVIWYDSSGTILYANQSAREIYGLNQNGAERSKVFEIDKSIAHQDDFKRGFWPRLHENKSFRHETSLLAQNGAEFPAEIHTNLVKFEDEVFAISFIQDISNRIESEKKLAQLNLELERLLESQSDELKQTKRDLVASQKHAALGKLAGGIAHEIRNPLNVIQTSTNFLMLKDDSEKKQKHLVRIQRQVDAIKEVIDSLVGLSAKKEVQKVRVNLLDYVKEVVGSSKIPDNIELLTKPFDPAICVSFDTGQMKIAIENLIRNACEAMPGGGQINISTDILSGCVKLVISDTGQGIIQDQLESILEPFFSSKPRGMGLGLSITQEALANNECELTVSNSDSGAVFAIHIPTDE